MSIFDDKSKKAKFIGENSGMYQIKEASKVLEVGKVYDVDRVIKGSFYSYLVLKGFKQQFAIEMFDGVPEN